MNYAHISVEPMTPNIGAMVSNVDLNAVRSDAVYEEIKAALWQYHVLFFRNQPIEPEPYIRLGKQFGELEEHEFFPHIEGYPQIQTIAHEGYDQPETDRWHTDVTFRARPSSVNLLRAVKLPPSGGDTVWSSTAAAFDALPDQVKTMLLGLKADHDLPHHQRRIDFYRRVEEGRIGGQSMMNSMANEHEFRLIEQNPIVTHPAVINHPVTGRLTLFVNSIWTKKFFGIHLDISDALLAMLFEWVKKPEFLVRFRWETDSLVIWDNFATQHYAVFDYAPHYRGMHRMTAGSAEPRLDMATVPAHLRPPAASAGNGVGPRSIVDTERLAAAPAAERAAVHAVFNALDGVDLDAIGARAAGI